jgi:hypothetical protein
LLPVAPTKPVGNQIVTEQNGTAAPAPAFPPGRYGRRREPRRRRPWLVAVLAGLVVLASLGLAYRLYRQYGDVAHVPRILSERERTDTHVTIRFEVVRRNADEPAVCHVRARARDGLVVGQADVTVPAGRRVELTYTLATTQRAFAVDIPRCRGTRG